MIKSYRTTCPLNCWDQCSFLVEVENGTLLSIKPDPGQKITGSLICTKGQQHLKRVNHPARLRHPLLKSGGAFKKISWEKALEIAAARISAAVDRYGPLSLLHYYDSGHGGVLKDIEKRFFSALGGCTTHRGSLCWGAGLAAQRYDFGAVLAHPFPDLVNARCILLWGRNPADTSLHLVPFIRKARENGARVVLIDPLTTASASLADMHIHIKPGTDGALALGMAHHIIAGKMIDGDFVEKHCSGYTQFKEMAVAYTPDGVAQITGIPAAQIRTLADIYATAKPAAILIGYGVQRYSNGGNIIRAIDALAALTGNIGVPGGGANYANCRVTHFINHGFLDGADLAPQHRYYAKPRLAAALAEFQEPPIEFAYISRGNPLTQMGDSNALRRTFAKIPFKIVAEHFMTDSAAAADLVLPATNFLEEEDLYFNSMSHSYISYGPRILKPPGECRSEYSFFGELARLLGVKGFPGLSSEALLKRIIAPLTAATGISLEQIKEGPLLLPGGDAIPWADHNFQTPDGKFNFYSATAAAEGCDPLPVYRAPAELGDGTLHEQGYRYWFVTPHPRDSIHTAHRIPGDSPAPRVYLNPAVGREHGLASGDRARISSPRGSIEAAVQLSNKVPPGAVLVYEGWWRASGAPVNNLTPDRLADMGMQAALYDCLCKIEKL
jgi:anaerobic selenocysteine-containing dehydrogenase